VCVCVCVCARVCACVHVCVCVQMPWMDEGQYHDRNGCSWQLDSPMNGIIERLCSLPRGPPRCWWSHRHWRCSCRSESVGVRDVPRAGSVSASTPWPCRRLHVDGRHSRVAVGAICIYSCLFAILRMHMQASTSPPSMSWSVCKESIDR
jgi:hypothetical protein